MRLVDRRKNALPDQQTDTARYRGALSHLKQRGTGFTIRTMTGKLQALVSHQDLEWWPEKGPKTTGNVVLNEDEDENDGILQRTNDFFCL